MQRVACIIGFEMRLVNAFLGFGLCQRLHVGIAVDVRGEHDIGCAVVTEEEDGFENVHDKVHRRDIIVVDDDLVERLEFGLGFFDDLDFRDGLEIHFKHEGLR